MYNLRYFLNYFSLFTVWNFLGEINKQTLADWFAFVKWVFTMLWTQLLTCLLNFQIVLKSKSWMKQSNAFLLTKWQFDGLRHHNNSQIALKLSFELEQNAWMCCDSLQWCLLSAGCVIDGDTSGVKKNNRYVLTQGVRWSVASKSIYACRVWW